MARTASILLILVAVPTVALVAKHSRTDPLVHPADATTIDGVDCGHVKSIIGKWGKSAKVGHLMGKAKAVSDAANQAATNADAAADQAERVGLAVGLNGAAPSSVADAVAVARGASTAAAGKALTLEATTGDMKTNMGTAHFGKNVTNAAIHSITTQTEETIVATADVNKAAARATKAAKEAKEAALKNTKGALRMINAKVSDIAKMSKEVDVMTQKIGFSVKDVQVSLDRSAATSDFMGKLSAYISDDTTGAGEQAPVWQARHDDIIGRRTALDDALTVVTGTDGKLPKLTAAYASMTDEETMLQGVVNASMSSQSAALGQAENIAKAEETLRTTKTAFDECKNAVGTMMQAKQRLDEKFEDTKKRLAKAPKGPSR